MSHSATICPCCGGLHEPSKALLKALEDVRRELEAIPDPQTRAEALAALDRPTHYINLDNCPEGHRLPDVLFGGAS
jgi:hypothetical protein